MILGALTSIEIEGVDFSRTNFCITIGAQMQISYVELSHSYQVHIIFRTANLPNNQP